MSYEFIVVGAGHNGLAAAVHLAAQGRKVLVIEARPEPGGAVKTQELTLPGYRHDLCAMNLSMFAGSAFCARYKDELGAHGLEFVPAQHCFASVFRDDSALGVGASLEETVSAIHALSPHDAVAWSQMVERFKDVAPYLFGLLGSPMPSWAAARTLFNAWRKQGTSGVYELIRLVLSSPRDFLDRHFENEKLKAMMAAWGLHVDFAPDAAGGALFPYLESMANQNFGMVIGKGGADTIIRAMTGLLKAKGGEIITGAPVRSITVSDGAARGVVLEDGRKFSASRAVIANLNPRLVFGGLLPAGSAPESFESKVKAFRPGPGAMMIHLATSGLPDWKAGAHLQKYAYVHVAPDLAMMSRVYAEAAAGLLPAEPVLVVGQPSALDPSRAPEGRHVLWVQVRVLPAQIKGDALNQIEGRDWDSCGQAYAERVLDLIEQYAPGIRGKILASHVMTPADLERENASLIGGDSLGGSHHLDQNFVFRPVAGYSRYRTPVKSLYLCGASTWPGAGTGAGSGFMLANMLAK
ncbi:MAG TPA: NAD(P)/FAD-dependent oxidoreductase [Pusillimonas sp.]|uniref:phytoene desaturase family protein n=1 Tax=Pusillimonas sp. TaxID=3040095 RepID=UPI002B4ACFDA|nr:NAD(P)/FAD-dependent oxidoreductase [Pusillimonas sp.]HLU19678.1 NAD(P)/FAD-dependent oxidoreductase [Pusillimonas sp.]